MKTLAAVLYETNKPLQIEELVIPELKPGQVLVNVTYSGICHSQLNEVRGLKGKDRFLPHTLGHEGAGIVASIGADVRKVKPGDHVVMTWIKGSGADVPSASYWRRNGSTVNSGAISTFMTRAVVSENRLVRIPDQIPLREAALLGCAVPTGAGMIMNAVKITDQSSVVIFGTGGIGLSALLAAKSLGAATIIAVDIRDDKLTQAMKLGATHIINAKKEDTLFRIMEITERRGADIAVEAAGRKQSMETAFKSVRDKGGLCVIAGNLPEGVHISINPFDLIKGKRITGTWGGETDPDKDIPVYAELFLSNRLDLKSLISDTYSLRDINDALNDLEKGKFGRLLIALSPPHE